MHPSRIDKNVADAVSAYARLWVVEGDGIASSRCLSCRAGSAFITSLIWMQKRGRGGKQAVGLDLTFGNMETINGHEAFVWDGGCYVYLGMPVTECPDRKDHGKQADSLAHTSWSVLLACASFRGKRGSRSALADYCSPSSLPTWQKHESGLFGGKIMGNIGHVGKNHEKHGPLGGKNHGKCIGH